MSEGVVFSITTLAPCEGLRSSSPVAYVVGGEHVDAPGTTDHCYTRRPLLDPLLGSGDQGPTATAGPAAGTAGTKDPWGEATAGPAAGDSGDQGPTHVGREATAGPAAGSSGDQGPTLKRVTLVAAGRSDHSDPPRPPTCTLPKACGLAWPSWKAPQRAQWPPSSIACRMAHCSVHMLLV